VFEFFPVQFHFGKFNEPYILCSVMCVQGTGRANGHHHAIAKSQSIHWFRSDDFWAMAIGEPREKIEGATVAGISERP
jgi:hypothetical protein